MRILLTGHNGRLGSELEQALKPLGDVLVHDHADMDLAQPDDIVAVVRETKPQVIVNAAADMDVNNAEINPRNAHKVNGVAPHILASEAKALGALLIHYSTDYVFDGEKIGPYTEEDEPNPINVHGRTKLTGECGIVAVGGDYLILRTSWVYATRGPNFLHFVRQRLKEHQYIDALADQYGSPTSARAVAAATAALLQRGIGPLADVRGTYHMTATGHTSRYTFALEVAYREQAPHPWRIWPKDYRDYDWSAARAPKNSVLSNEKLQRLGITLPSWRTCLKEFYDRGIPAR